MKTLKDVYIKVTDKNKEEIKQIIGFRPYYEYVCFEWDGLDSAVTKDNSGLKQKISLRELKRLAETIPTREEIIRLKRQISAYKTNYDKVVKHSLSKEVVINDVLTHNEWLQCKLEESGKKQNLLQNLYDDVLNEIEELKKANSLYFEMSVKNVEENERLKNKKWYQIWNK